MKRQLEDLQVLIRALQDDVEAIYREAREDLARQQALLAVELKRWQRQYKVGLLRYLLNAKPLVVLTAPLVYLGWVPFVLMDVFISVYQSLCFPIYRIPKVRRAEYMVFDRGGLSYLNMIERLNCVYCSYGNGVVAYAREVSARTEQYWCPIKYAHRLNSAHDRYSRFVTPGDAEHYHQELDRLRKDYEDLRAQLKKALPVQSMPAKPKE